MKRKRRAGGNPNRRLEITNGISGWCGANTSRQVCDFSRSDTKTRLHVPGGLIGQLLYQWEGVIQLSHVGRAPCGMTGVFISTKPSNTAEPLDILYKHPRKSEKRRGYPDGTATCFRIC